MTLEGSGLSIRLRFRDVSKGKAILVIGETERQRSLVAHARFSFRVDYYHDDTLKVFHDNTLVSLFLSLSLVEFKRTDRASCKDKRECLPRSCNLH